MRSPEYAVEYKRVLFKGQLVSDKFSPHPIVQPREKHVTDKTCFCNVKISDNFNLEHKLPTSVQN